MVIKNLEKALNARYVGPYTPGHTGIQILRFERYDRRNCLVAKFAPTGDPQAFQEIDANLFGYERMKELGASAIVPPDMNEVSTEDGRAIVMRDLGFSMKVLNGGLGAGVLLWKHLVRAVEKTVVDAHTPNVSEVPAFVAEVLAHIDRFTHHGVPELLVLIRNTDWTGVWGKEALMLLDFTPDNLFIHEAGASFIDPWRQMTYLGHPAVSVGQFVTNMQRVGMKEAVEAGRMLEDRCFVELHTLLGCDVSAVSRAFNLGKTLQLVLSSYVRRESERDLATQLMAQAHGLWM